MTAHYQKFRRGRNHHRHEQTSSDVVTASDELMDSHPKVGFGQDDGVTVGDMVASGMDEIEPAPPQIPKRKTKSKPLQEDSEIVSADRDRDGRLPSSPPSSTSSLRPTGVRTAVAYRVTLGNDPVPVLVLPGSETKAGAKESSDWRVGAKSISTILNNIRNDEGSVPNVDALQNQVERAHLRVVGPISSEAMLGTAHHPKRPY